MSPVAARHRSSRRLVAGGSAYVEVLDLPKVRHDLDRLMERMNNLRPAWAPIVAELEASERALFGAYGGKYVKTGALEASLTQTAATGAIRRLNRKSLAFGSKVWYARFQGTRGKGRHKAPSAVLRSAPELRQRAARTVMEYIVHGGTLEGLL